MKNHTNCRACGSNKLIKYLDLGLMPLANNLELTADSVSERFPLEVLFCQVCALSQLSVVIPPEKLYSQYTYRSGGSNGYKQHCRQMAKDLKREYNLIDPFHIDVAGNDGTLLQQFNFIIGGRKLNIDPAANLTSICELSGIDTHTSFLDKTVALDVVQKYGQADLITATNVFAHVDDIREFMLSCRFMLKNNGVLVIECPYIVDFIEKNEFNQVYFEHLSYMSLKPIMAVADRCEMQVIDVSHNDIHGGTMRVTLSKCNRDGGDRFVKPSVSEWWHKEKDFHETGKYDSWAWCGAINSRIQLINGLWDIFNGGYKIASFAASAKGNTLLNYAGIKSDLVSYIVDDTAEKQGKYSPGTGIPIVSADMLISNPPDYLLILSENFADEIIERCRPIYKGKFILALPEFKIIE